MITTLPPFHVPTKYEGYYWNLQEKCLYSIKSGNLRSLKMRYPNRFNRIRIPGWTVSVKGRKKFLPISYLNSLNIFNIIHNPSKHKGKRKKR